MLYFQSFSVKMNGSRFSINTSSIFLELNSSKSSVIKNSIAPIYIENSIPTQIALWSSSLSSPFPVLIFSIMSCKVALKRFFMWTIIKDSLISDSSDTPANPLIRPLKISRASLKSFIQSCLFTFESFQRCSCQDVKVPFTI